MSGPRILVVEDEFLLACSLQEELERLGYRVVGPCSSLATATATAANETFDAALLDVNLSGTMVYPLADQLAATGIPFVFLSGYGTAAIPDRFRDRPRLSKPSEAAAVHRELRRVLEARPVPAAAGRSSG